MIVYNHQQKIALTEIDKSLLNEQTEPSSNKEYAINVCIPERDITGCLTSVLPSEGSVKHRLNPYSN